MEFLLLCFQLVEDSMIKLDRICREANVMLIFSRFYGLTGFVRISLKVICYKFMVKVYFLSAILKSMCWIGRLPLRGY